MNQHLNNGDVDTGPTSSATYLSIIIDCNVSLIEHIGKV